MEQFGLLLRQHRLRLGLSQVQLANRSAYSPSIISRFERGVRRPRYVPIVNALADALDLSKEDRDSFLESAGFTARRDQSEVESLENRLGQLETLMRDVLSALKERSHENVIDGWRDLMDEWGYVDRESREKSAKKAIARWVVTNIIKPAGDKVRIALDSGTTMAAVASELVDQQIHVGEIFTNNTVLLPMLVNRFRVVLSGGVFETPQSWNSFGATLGSIADLTAENYHPDLAILGCTSVSFEGGPCSPTPSDRSFKRALVEAAMRSNGSIIIGADYRKFVDGPRAGDVQIFESSDWERIREHVTIVTASNPDDAEGLSRLSMAIADFRDRVVQVA